MAFPSQPPAECGGVSIPDNAPQSRRTAWLSSAQRRGRRAPEPQNREQIKCVMPLTFEMISYIAIYKQKRHAGRMWRPVPAHDDQESETKVLPDFPLEYEREHWGL